MSSIWTPSGERPIPRDPDPAPPRHAPPPQAPPPGGLGEATDEEIRAHLAAVAQQMLETPAEIIIANHCIGLFQLAALHLEEGNLDDARLAIDALGGIVETLGPRLGEEEPTLREALSQLRLAYVQRSKQSGAG